MFKKYLISALVLLCLIISVTSVFAAPDRDIGLVYWPVYFQNESPWEDDVFAGKGKCTIEVAKNGKKKCNCPDGKRCMKDRGCATTAMTMLLRGYGLKWIPDQWHYPISEQWLKPGGVDDWLVDNHGYDSGDLQWLNTVSKFYYYGYPYLNFYYYLAPNYDCAPYGPGRNQNCFIVQGWSDKAVKLLDNDLEFGISDIAQIKWKEEVDSGWTHPSHFVMIGGYSMADAEYRDYDPNSAKYPGNHIPPRGFNVGYGTGNYKLLGLRRFIGLTTRAPANLARLDYGIHSPVEIQVIDPQGRITGHDPATGTKIQGDPMSLYYEEEPISSVDSEELPAEPVKMLSVVEPKAGNYIMKMFGTGAGRIL